jgi:hypothetical protein
MIVFIADGTLIQFVNQQISTSCRRRLLLSRIVTLWRMSPLPSSKSMLAINPVHISSSGDMLFETPRTALKLRQPSSAPSVFRQSEILVINTPTKLLIKLHKLCTTSAIDDIEEKERREEVVEGERLVSNHGAC